MTARKPSAAQLAVLLSLAEGRDPLEGFTGNAKTGRARTIYSCERAGWIMMTMTRNPPLTPAGREAVRRAR